MDINCLLKEELEFELACRGILNLNGVQTMRKVLREVVKREKQGTSAIKFEIPESCVSDVTGQLAQCKDKLGILTVNLSEISSDPDRDSMRRINSRLLHLKHRIKLIAPSSQEEINQHSKLCTDIESCLDTLTSLKQASKEDVDTITEEEKEILRHTLGDEAIEVIEDLENASPEKKGIKQTTPKHNIPANNLTDQYETKAETSERRRDHFVRSSTLERDFQPRKLVPIKDWGIKFNGRGGLSVNALLERIDEIKIARNANDIDLWRYAIDFFEGDALIWYRANKEYMRNWKDLVRLLLESFQSPQYQDELWEEIKKRTQGRHENVNIYIAVMQNMFCRLPEKPTESQKLAILLKNLQPYYQKAVCRDVFHSVLGLTLVLRVLERTKLNCDSFKEPKTTIDALEPDLAYQGTSSDEVAAVGAFKPLNNNTTNFTDMKCWNCRVVGHTFRNCAIPKQRLFCYRCGKFGQTTSGCGCKNQGNDKLEGITPAGCPPKQ